MGKNRDAGIDLAKSLAILAVLMIHTASIAVSAWPMGSFRWWSEMAWGSAVRWAVPVFFLCSGALFLGRDIPLKTLLGKYVLRLLAAFLVWAALYEAFDVARGLNTPLGAVKSVLTLNGHFHFYYLVMILLVYLFQPLLRLITKHADRRLLRYILLLWLLTGILIPTVGGVWPFSLFTRVNGYWYLPMTYAAMGYALLGWYLRENPVRARWGVLCLLAGFALTLGATVSVTLSEGAFRETFWGGMTLGPCLMAAGVFALCRGYRGSSRLVRQISLASFCVYLCHDFFNILLRHFALSPVTLAPWWSVPALSLLVLAASCAVYIVLRRVPWVNRWLV